MEDYIKRDMASSLLKQEAELLADISNFSDCSAMLRANVIIESIPADDVVKVVRCKDCRFANPYERMDGETGYYCKFCGHVFNYGTNLERLFAPIKEGNDFCSCGELRQ